MWVAIVECSYRECLFYQCWHLRHFLSQEFPVPDAPTFVVLPVYIFSNTVSPCIRKHLQLSPLFSVTIVIRSFPALLMTSDKKLGRALPMNTSEGIWEQQRHKLRHVKNWKISRRGASPFVLFTKYYFDYEASLARLAESVARIGEIKMS